MAAKMAVQAIYRAGVDRAEADIVLAVLAGERQREVLPGGVGGPRADFPIRRFHAIVADQVHHPPAALLDHDRQRVAQTPDVAHEFELQALLPIVFGQVLDDAAGRRAGIVDHDVDAAERLVTLLDEILGVGVLAQVGGNGNDLAIGNARDVLGGGLERLLATCADGDVDAFLRQRQRDALADAFAAARHQSRLALQFEVHSVLLPAEC